MGALSACLDRRDLNRVSEQVYAVQPYWGWNRVKRGQMSDEQWERSGSGRVLAMKSPQTDTPAALAHFFKKLRDCIPRGSALVLYPRSQAGEWSIPMEDLLVELLARNPDLVNGIRALRRYRSKQPAHRGGPRGIEAERVTLRLDTELAPRLKRRPVVVFDDLYTTGASMGAAFERLARLRPASLTGIVLGRTV